MYRKLGEPQRRSRRCGEEKKIPSSPLFVIEPRSIQADEGSVFEVNPRNSRGLFNCPVFHVLKHKYLYIHLDNKNMMLLIFIKHSDFPKVIFFKKALTVLRGPLAYPNGLLDLHIETFW
jgi:hypothetical protein